MPAVLKRPDVPVYGVWQCESTIEIEKLTIELPSNRNESIAYLTQLSQAYYERKIREQPVIVALATQTLEGLILLGFSPSSALGSVELPILSILSPAKRLSKNISDFFIGDH